MRETDNRLHPSPAKPTLFTTPLYMLGGHEERLLPSPLEGLEVLLVLPLFLESEGVLFNTLPSDDVLKEAVVAVGDTPLVAKWHWGLTPLLPPKIM
jgi:hypothetical protein